MLANPIPMTFIGLEAGPQYAQDKRVEKRKKEADLVKQSSRQIYDKKTLNAEAVQFEGPTAKMIKKEVQKHQCRYCYCGPS